MKTSNYHEIIVNSKDRIYAADKNNDFKVQMPSNIQFNKLRVQACSIPFSYHVINSSNNQLQLNYNSGLTQQTINIPVGTYTTTQFVNYINSLSIGSPPISLSFDETRGRYKWSDPTVVMVKTQTGSNLDQILGFISSASLTNPGIFPYAPQMSGPNTIHIRSKYLGSTLTPNSYTTTNYKNQSRDIIATAKVNCNYGETIFMERDLAVDNFFNTLKPSFLNIVDFQLTFEDANSLVPLPANAEWEMRIAFYFDEVL